MSEQRAQQGNGSDVAIRNVDIPLDYTVLEHVIGTGDLSKLTTRQRVEYYGKTCEALGVNPLTRPFRFMSFQGQTVMYATRDLADQLRNLRNISLAVVDQKLDGDLFIVTVRATMPGGRNDEDMGAVTMGNLQGDARANAILKAITKAKRRVTLSICGLGFNDETEIETLTGAVTYDHDADAVPPPVKDQPKALPSGNGQNTTGTGDKPRRTFASLLDEIEADAKAALTEEDIDQLERRDDRVLFCQEKGSDAVKGRLARIFTEERERIQAFQAPPVDPLDEPLPEELQNAPEPADQAEQEAATLLAAYRSAPTRQALDSLKNSMRADITIKMLTNKGDGATLKRLDEAYEARAAELRAKPETPGA